MFRSTSMRRRHGALSLGYFQMRLAPPARTNATMLDPTNAALTATLFMLTPLDRPG